MSYHFFVARLLILGSVFFFSFFGLGGAFSFTARLYLRLFLTFSARLVFSYREEAGGPASSGRLVPLGYCHPAPGGCL